MLEPYSKDNLIMNNNQSNLQYIFACLMTRSKWVKAIHAKPDTLYDYFELQDSEYRVITNCLYDNYNNILNNSLLTEEKRWREIQLAIKCTRKIINESDLKFLWALYLSRFNICDSIPLSPLIESITFLRLIQKFYSNWLTSSIIKYEITRNECLLFKFSNFNRKNNNLKELFRSGLINNCFIQLNPSFIYKKFDCDVMHVIKNVSDLQGYSCVEKSHHYIGFYKKYTNESVRSINLQGKLLTLLMDSKDPISVQAWAKTLPNDHKNKLVEYLYRHELISLEPRSNVFK